MAANKYDANSISILEGLEAVRMRPGMYIGSVGTKGLNHLIYEIADNSVDEHLAGFCTQINVTLNDDGTATIKDNGRGIPIGIHPKAGIPAVEVVFTVLHAGGKFGDGGYKISGGLHGVGASVVNALSVWLEVEIRVDGGVYKQRYERGKATAPLEKIGTCRKNDTGTTVTFLPDGEIFEKTRFKADSIKSRLHETAYLNPGLTIEFEDKRKGSEDKETFHEPDGLKAYIKDLNNGKETVCDIVYFKKKQEDIEVEVAFQFVNEFEENILGFCNNIYTQEGGTHITGFKTKFTMIINQYARELGILKDKDANFTGLDVRNGMTAVVAVKHPAPRFEGQTKTKLDNPDAGTVVANVTGDEVQLYFDRHLDDLNAVIACAEKSAKIRKAEEKAKTNMLTKQKFSIDSNGKLANMYGFEVYEFENCPYFTKEGTKVPFKNSPSGTDHQASFCFYTKRVFRAQGSTKMYYRDAQTNPDYQQNEVNFRHYYIVLPKKMEALGAIYSYDGTTEQTSDQEVEADKNWATVRREAEAAKMAMVLSEGGAKGVNGLEEKLQEDPAAGEELEA